MRPVVLLVSLVLAMSPGACRDRSEQLAPQARPVYKLLRAAKDSDAQELEAAFSQRMQSSLEAGSSWGEIAETYHDVLEREIADVCGPLSATREAYSDQVLRRAEQQFRLQGEGDPPLRNDDFRRYEYVEAARRPKVAKPYQVEYPGRQKAPTVAEAVFAETRLSRSSQETYGP